MISFRILLFNFASATLMPEQDQCVMVNNIAGGDVLGGCISGQLLSRCRFGVFFGFFGETKIKNLTKEISALMAKTKKSTIL